MNRVGDKGCGSPTRSMRIRPIPKTFGKSVTYLVLPSPENDGQLEEHTTGVKMISSVRQQ